MSVTGDCLVCVTALVTGEWTFMERLLRNWKVVGYAALWLVYIGILLLLFFVYFLLCVIKCLLS